MVDRQKRITRAYLMDRVGMVDGNSSIIYQGMVDGQSRITRVW